jgi:1,4-alpha-glucan branching enzyme
MTKASKGGKTGRRRVKFQVRAPQDAKVFLAGSFNDWNGKKKKLIYNKAEMLFKGTALLEKGIHQYKFVINEEWCVDPECPDWERNEFGSLNSVVYVS